MPINAQFLTLIQHPAISSIILSSRVHSAAVHCGAVRFVGSVRMRERYCVFDWVAEASGGRCKQGIRRTCGGGSQRGSDTEKRDASEVQVARRMPKWRLERPKDVYHDCTTRRASDRAAPHTSAQYPSPDVLRLAAGSPAPQKRSVRHALGWSMHGHPVLQRGAEKGREELREKKQGSI